MRGRDGRAEGRSATADLDRELGALVRRLAEIDAAARARRPAPLPGRDLPSLHSKRSRYDTARRALEEREASQRERESWADVLAEELLPPLAPGSGSLEETLRALQTQILRHPVAFRAGFAALVEEGRRFAETPEGAAWTERLEASPHLPSARLLLNLVSLSMLGDGDPERLPSAYVEALVRSATSGEADELLERLFGGSGDA